MVSMTLSRLLLISLVVVASNTIVIEILKGNNDNLINAFQTYSDIEKKEVYQNYLTEFQKNYDTGNSQNYHFEIFSQNMNTIWLHNSSGSSYKEGINQFTDVSKEEMQRTHMGLLPRELHKFGN